MDHRKQLFCSLKHLKVPSQTMWAPHTRELGRLACVLVSGKACVLGASRGVSRLDKLGMRRSKEWRSHKPGRPEHEGHPACDSGCLNINSTSRCLRFCLCQKCIKTGLRLSVERFSKKPASAGWLSDVDRSPWLNSRRWWDCIPFQGGMG